jgi:hypothetical protein
LYHYARIHERKAVYLKKAGNIYIVIAGNGGKEGKEGANRSKY